MVSQPSGRYDGNEKLESPLPEILTVMSICNRAQLEGVRKSARRVQQKLQRNNLMKGPTLKKKFTVMLVYFLIFESLMFSFRLAS